MPEQNKPEDKGPAGLLRDSSFLRLPWRQVFRKRVLAVTLSPVALFALFTMPQMAADAYTRAPAGHGVVSALAAMGIGFVLCVLLALHLVLCVAVFWGLAIDIARLSRDIRTQTRKLPAAWAEFRAGCSRLRSGLGRAWRGLLALPAALRATTAEQRAEAAFMAVAFTVLALIAWLGWTPASRLAAGLPVWLMPEPDFLGTLMIDIFGSCLIWAFVMPILTHLVFRLFPALRPRRAGKPDKR